MITLTVELAKNSYNILIGPGALAELNRAVGEHPCQKVMVVTDENVWQSHGPLLTAALAGAGKETAHLVLPPGESAKSLDTLGEICGALARGRFTRQDLLVAFGGGVVGDVCGFAAATYMRGVPFMQVPTTLLAMVDSSVGGKTAVNLPEGKNLIGAFASPPGS